MTASYFLMALWRMNDSSGMNTYLPLLLKHAGVTKERAMPQASPLVLNTSLRSRRLMLSSLISPKGITCSLSRSSMEPSPESESFHIIPCDSSSRKVRTQCQTPFRSSRCCV